MTSAPAASPPTEVKAYAAQVDSRKNYVHMSENREVSFVISGFKLGDLPSATVQIDMCPSDSIAQDRSLKLHRTPLLTKAKKTKIFVHTPGGPSCTSFPNAANALRTMRTTVPVKDKKKNELQIHEKKKG